MKIEKKHPEDLDCEDGACAIDFSQESEPEKESRFNKAYLLPIIGLFFLLLGIGFEFFEIEFFQSPIPLIWFGAIYLFIGGPIVLKAAKLVAKGDIYNEFVLMSVATLGAFFNWLLCRRYCRNALLCGR